MSAPTKGPIVPQTRGLDRLGDGIRWKHEPDLDLSPLHGKVEVIVRRGGHIHTLHTSKRIGEVVETCARYFGGDDE